MFKWFSTIFSLVAPGGSGNLKISGKVCMIRIHVVNFIRIQLLWKIILCYLLVSYYDLSAIFEEF